MAFCRCDKSDATDEHALNFDDSNTKERAACEEETADAQKKKSCKKCEGDHKEQHNVIQLAMAKNIAAMKSKGVADSTIMLGSGENAKINVKYFMENKEAISVLAGLTNHWAMSGAPLEAFTQERCWINLGCGKALDISGNSNKDNAELIVYDKNSKANQRFRWNTMANEEFRDRIRSAANLGCMCPTADGSKPVYRMNFINHYDEQNWLTFMSSAGEDSVLIINKRTGGFLGVLDGKVVLEFGKVVADNMRYFSWKIDQPDLGAQFLNVLTLGIYDMT